MSAVVVGLVTLSILLEQAADTCGGLVMMITNVQERVAIYVLR